ncbi:MAG: FAD-dependent oxidoreductase [Phycisphaeraceae bacterium]
MTETLQADVAIIGGGFGAVAAALALTDRGYQVVMTDEFHWIGGQVTSQALCVLDELYDPVGETIMNARYAEFRQRVRDHYRTKYRLSPLGAAQRHLCVGNAACSPVTAEPHVAHAVLQDMLADAIAQKRLTVFTRHVPISAMRDGDRAVAVTCRDLDHPNQTRTFQAAFFLDGTETGDTYPLLNLPHGLGSDPRWLTGEEHAPDEPLPDAVQSFTYCTVVEFVPGGDFTIPKPDNYETLRDNQPFKLGNLGATRSHPGKFFELTFTDEGNRVVPFWLYRCLVDHRNFDDPAMPYSRAVLNVGSNDYKGESFIDHDDPESVLEAARQLSRAYLYWLQTEAPRDDGGFGYPELRPMPEATGTPDGVAQAPYIREGRRLRACETIVEEDLSTRDQHQARARQFTNSVGVGAYMIDIHNRSAGTKGMVQMTRPYQVPLGALVSPEMNNFAVANKGIGVTQITNGAYRLHPLEWEIGEAAGELAAYCLEHRIEDRIEHPNLTGQALFDFQRRLLQQGVPLYWYEDLPPDDPAFEAAQLLALTNIWPGHPDHLRFEGHQSICRHRPMFLQVCQRLKDAGKDVTELRDLHVIAHGSRKGDVVQQLALYLDRIGWPDAALTRTFPSCTDAQPQPLDPARLW